VAVVDPDVAMPDWTEPFARTIDAAKKYVVRAHPGSGRLERGGHPRGSEAGRSAAQAGAGQATGAFRQRWRRLGRGGRSDSRRRAPRSVFGNVIADLTPEVGVSMEYRWLETTLGQALVERTNNHANAAFVVGF
jgi:hypothetical protein